MPDAVVETPAASSPAPVMEASRGPLVNLTPEQRTEFRKTGELPKAESKQETPQEESAPSQEETPKPTEETQEEQSTQQEPTQTKPQESKRRPDAEARIKQLTDRIKELEANQPARVEAPKPENPQEPAKPQNYQEWRKTFKPSVWIEEYAKANPEATYEDANAAMADYLGDVRDQFRTAEQQQQIQQREFQSKVAEAKARYGDKFDEVLAPAVTAIIGDQSVSGVVKSMLNDSEVLPDLMFTIGSDATELANFVKMAKENPGKAIRYIALTESLIRDELEGKQASEPPAAPVKPQTQAPRPPAEVGGRAASPGDALEEAAKAGDFRSFKAESTRRELARMKTG